MLFFAKRLGVEMTKRWTEPEKEALALKAAARIDELERALYGAAESLASFRPRPGDRDPDQRANWTELDEVTLHDAQRLCGKYPQSETEVLKGMKDAPMWIDDKPENT